MPWDVIVVGTGGIGSAAVDHLVSRGLRVLALDRFHPPHTHGSSHGATRLIRRAYFEDTRYMPLVRRAYELWSELEARSGRQLYTRCGFLVLTEGGTDVSTRMLAAAREHGIALDLLTAADVRERFPAFALPDPWTGQLEHDAGHLAVERCIQTHLDLARGADFRFNERVLSWKATPHHVTVQTDQGSYEAGALVLAPGAWTPELAAELHLPLVVRRGPQFWFPARPEHRDLPCYAFAGNGKFIYGFPDLGQGLKVADYEPSSVLADPLDRDPAYTEAELGPVAEAVRQHLPGATPRPASWSICMYTLTPDENFVLDRHPEHPNVAFFAGDSGHAFKFAPALGEALAELVTRGQPTTDVAFLRHRSFHGAL